MGGQCNTCIWQENYVSTMKKKINEEKMKKHNLEGKIEGNKKRK